MFLSKLICLKNIFMLLLNITMAYDGLMKLKADNKSYAYDNFKWGDFNYLEKNT